MGRGIAVGSGATRHAVGIAIAVVLTAGCGQSATATDGGSDGGGADADGDGGPSTEAPPPCGQVDLLFMVDNSNSMAEEQQSLAEVFPRIVHSLARGELTDPDTGDVTRTFHHAGDINVGVVSSDMGTGGFTVPTCDDSADGDDGILQSDGNTSIGGCTADYPSFLNFVPGDDIDAFASDFECVARLGTDGCGFEQQLESVLKAVTPSSSAVIGSGPDQIEPFLSGSGHADGMNSGFIRPESLLGLVLVTDEDDCSARDPELFNPESTRYTSDLNLRCFQYPEAVFPVSRFVTGLRHVRRDAPGRLLFAAIVGIPVDLGGEDPDTILDDARMQKQIDSDMPTRLEPSCNVPGRGLAFPPRRIVQTAQQLRAEGTATTVGSICQQDLTPAVDPILERIADAVDETCR